MAITPNGNNECVFKQGWVIIYADFQVINKNIKLVWTTHTSLCSTPVHTLPLYLLFEKFFFFLKWALFAHKCFRGVTNTSGKKL